MFKRKLLSWVSGLMILAMVAGSALPVLTAFAVTNTRSEDLIFQKDSTGNVVAILSKNRLITPIGDVLVIYNASGVATGIKTIYGEVIAISGTGTTYTLPVATSSVLGGIKPDNITITVNASGVASATASGVSDAGTLTGTTLASNVTASSLLSAAGGSFGTAAYTASTNYLGAASNAVSASSVPVTGVTGLGSGVASAAAAAVNTAGGLAAVEAGGKIPASICPAATSAVAGCISAVNQSKVDETMAASAPTGTYPFAYAIDTTHIGFAALGSGLTLTDGGTASATVSATGTAASGIVAGSTLTAGDMLKAGGAGSAVPATAGVDYIAPGGAAQSSASVAVTLDSTFLNTTTPNYSTGASDAVWTIPLAASIPANVGDTIYLSQSGVGGLAVSAVSGVTVLSEGSKLSLYAQHAVAALKKLSDNVWLFVGARK